MIIASLCYTPPFFFLLLWIVYYVLHFCKSSEMLTWDAEIHVLCLFYFVDKCVFIRMGEVRMQDGGFHFREWSYDEVISFIISWWSYQLFIAVEISITPFPLLMYLLNCLQNWELIWLANFIYRRKYDSFKIGF